MTVLNLTPFEIWPFRYLPNDYLGNVIISNRIQVRTVYFQLQYEYLSAPILPIDPQDQEQPILRDPVNGLSMILSFYGQNLSRHCSWKGAIQILALFDIRPFTLAYDLQGQVFVWLVSHVLPYLPPWVGCRLEVVGSRF